MAIYLIVSKGPVFGISQLVQVIEDPTYGKIETDLSNGIAAVVFAALVVAGTMWCGSATTPVELFGPTRHQWDQGYFSKKYF